MNTIELNLLDNKYVVAKMQGIPLANENSYRIIAGEENATKFEIVSKPTQYASARYTVEMINSNGYGIAETDIANDEFVLPVGMAVAGYGYISIKAYLNDEIVVFTPLKIKVWNTIAEWREEVSDQTGLKIENGKLYQYYDNSWHLVGSVGTRRIKVTTLPETDIDTNAIYLVPASNPTETNIYDEWAYVVDLNTDNYHWELIGGSGGGGGDLTDYTPNGGYSGTAHDLKTLIDNLDSEIHYVEPTIATLAIRAQVDAVTKYFNADIVREVGSQYITVYGFKHKETNISNFSGNLTYSVNGALITTPSMFAPKSTETEETIVYRNFSGDDTQSLVINGGTATFTLQGTSKKGTTISKTLQVRYYYPSYIVKSTTDITTADLTSSNKVSSASLSGTRTVTLTEDSMIYFVSTTTINTIKSGGFDVPFTQLDNITYQNGTYKVYRVGEPTNMILAGTYTYIIA